MNRKLKKTAHDELQTRNLYSKQNIILMSTRKRIRWADHASRVGENRSAYKVYVGKSEETRPMGCSRRGWEDNIKMDIGKIGWGYGLDSSDEWRALVNTIINFRVL
jgi:hypothetical protein